MQIFVLIAFLFVDHNLVVTKTKNRSLYESHPTTANTTTITLPPVIVQLQTQLRAFPRK